MIDSLFKAIALGGSAVIGGGTIISQVLFSNPKQEEPKNKAQEVSEEVSDEGGTCTIYEGQKNRNYRRLDGIRRKWDSRREFFKEVESQHRGLWNLTTLKREVRDGCANSTTKRIYVWWGPVPYKQDTWVFSQDINKTDWLKRDDVAIPDHLKLAE